MDTVVNRDLFFEKLNALIATKREDNCAYFSQEKYSKILNEVLSAKTRCSTPLDYRRLKRFDILEIDNELKLISPVKPGESNIQYYVTNDELFEILSETHTRIGHGGRTRMLKDLQVKYKNITYEVVMLYLNLCKKCQMKRSAPKTDIIVAKPKVRFELDSRCQVDLIDMQTQSDGEYKFIMVYQDHLTKFVQLRPLKTESAEEVAHHVLPILLTFGAPAILQSDNGREFSSLVVSKLCAMWKDVKMVHGKTHHSQTQNSVESAGIKNMITAWMNDNSTNKWSDGLPFVQFAKNTAYHEGIRQSPYKAMFGVKPKRGIAVSSLTNEHMANIETEEQLEEIANTFETEEQLEETASTFETEELILPNSFEENLSNDHSDNHIPKISIEDNLQPTTSSCQAQTEQHNFASAKRVTEKENLLQVAKMLRTSKNNFPSTQVGDAVPDVNRDFIDSREMCWQLLE